MKRWITLTIRAALLAYIVLCVFMYVRLAGGAPAPSDTKPKKTTKAGPPGFVGTWRMYWGSTTADVVFSKDSGYWCLYNGSQYVGWWKLDGNVMTLHEGKIPDQPDSVPAGAMEWKITLTTPDQRTGSISRPDTPGVQTTTFKLVPVNAPEELKTPTPEN